MTKLYHIQSVSFREDLLVVKVDGRTHEFPLEKVSPRLLSANVVKRSKFNISPGGYGIHWPLLDEDISINGLFQLKHQIKKIQTASRN